MRSRRRVAATVVEVLVGFGVAATLLIGGLEAFRFFTLRTQASTTQMLLGRQIGLVLDRLGRLLKFAHRVEAIEGGLRILVRQWKDGSWTLVPWTIRFRDAQAHFEGPGSPLRLDFPFEAEDFQLEEKDGSALTLRFRKPETSPGVGGSTPGTAIDPQGPEAILGEDWNFRVLPSPPHHSPLVLPPGESLDLETETLWLAQAAGSPLRPPAEVDQVGAQDPSGHPSPPSERRALVPPGSGPLRDSLFTEASVLSAEVSGPGRSSLPLSLGPHPKDPPLDLLAAIRDLEGKGHPIRDATLIGVFLAGMQVPNRIYRAASLAALSSKLADRDASDQVALIRGTAPGLIERTVPADRLDRSPPPPPGLFFPRDLIWAASVIGMGDAAKTQSGDSPRGFGGWQDPPQVGPEPDWNTWQTVLPSGELPQEVWSRLPPDLQGDLTPVAASSPGLPGGNDLGSPQTPGGNGSGATPPGIPGAGSGSAPGSGGAPPPGPSIPPGGSVALPAEVFSPPGSGSQADAAQIQDQLRAAELQTERANDLSIAEDNLAITEGRLAEEESQLQSLQLQLFRQYERLSMAEYERDQLNNELAQLEADLADCMRAYGTNSTCINASYASQRRALTEQIENKTAVVESAQTQVDRTQELIDAQEETIAKTESEIEGFSSEISTLEAALQE